MTGDDHDGILRREFVSIATGEYASPGWEKLPVDEELRVVRDWLCSKRLGGRTFTWVHQELAAGPEYEQIRSAFAGRTERHWRSTVAGAVYITGHGYKAHGSHWVVLRETEQERLYSTALRTVDLIAWLRESGIEQLLLIIDVCFADAVQADFGAIDRRWPPGWLVLGGAARDSKAPAFGLTSALEEFFRRLDSAEGAAFGREETLNASEFVNALRAISRERVIPISPVPIEAFPCLPNPHYRPPDIAPLPPALRDLALSGEDLRMHWSPRARGLPAPVPAVSDGWHFSGREQLMRDLVAATRGEPRVLVVSGGAGSGKSAALSRLVTLSDRGFRTEYAAYTDRLVEGELIPEVGAVDAAVVATGKSELQVATQLAEALWPEEADSAGPLTSLEAWFAVWRDWLSRRQSVTVVVDAVDEARDPRLLIRDLLAWLDPPGPGPRRLRLLLGMRSPGGVAATDGPSLVAHTRAVLRAEVLAVDQEPYWSEDYVAAYAASLLLSEEGSPYAGHTTEAEAAGRSIASAAEKSFLVAQLAAGNLARRGEGRPRELLSTAPAVGSDIFALFHEDLHAALPDPADRRRALVLLRAAAFAQGRGIPWQTIWPAVARAVALTEVDGVAGEATSFGDEDIAWLLGTRLSGYLVTDREDHTTVYRLFHESLRAVLQDRWSELHDPPDRPNPRWHLRRRVWRRRGTNET